MTQTTPPESRYPPRVRAALQHLDAAGVPRRNAAPPLHRLLWRCGLSVPPPLLAGIVANALFMGLWFGGGWGLAMWLLLWRAQGLHPLAMLAFAALAGVLFGGIMAAVMHVQRRRRGLPLWRDLPPTAG